MPPEPLRCPDQLPDDLVSALEDFGIRWAASPLRPAPAADTVRQWQDLLDSWVADRELPLLIRKASQGRGSVLVHSSGRRLVPTDNSPAHWAFLGALSGRCPSLASIESLLESGEIPVALAIRSGERSQARYRGVRRRTTSLNALGWKLCHIQPVGLRSPGSLSDFDAARLESHFRHFLDPGNMFVVPLSWSGIGEIPEIIESVSRHDARKALETTPP